MFKNKKWICNFIALVILISGMWIDEVKTDSIFLYSKTKDTALETSAVLSDMDVESIEILCTRSAISSSQIAAQIVNSKKVIKLSMMFLCLAVFALLLSNFYTAERVAELPILCTQAAVLHYIHNADGKK